MNLYFGYLPIKIGFYSLHQNRGYKYFQLSCWLELWGINKFVLLNSINGIRMLKTSTSLSFTHALSFTRSLVCSLARSLLSFLFFLYSVHMVMCVSCNAYILYRVCKFPWNIKTNVIDQVTQNWMSVIIHLYQAKTILYHI